MKHLACSLLFVLLLTAGSTAQAPGFTVYGEGSSSCGTWIKDKETYSRTPAVSAYFVDKAWAVGFVSGAGYVGSKLRKTDVAGIDAFMDAYCQAHPLNTIVDGAEALVDELGKASSNN